MRYRIYFLILSLLAMPCYANVSLDDKIAQMIMVGFNGLELKKDNPIYHDIKTHKIGGVILFNENVDKKHPEYVKNIDNPEQVKALITDLQSISATPLFVAIDQEGGKVSRLNTQFNVSTKSATELGNINNPELTYKEALKTASSLKNLGFNVNFAPCIDVNINPKSPIAFKERTFSADAQIVANHASQVVKAHSDKGVLSVLKHFPGHGSSTGDSHAGFVDVSASFDASELVPYQQLIDIYTNQIGVMTTHVFNRHIDDKNPLSLSKNSITGILKNKLNFNGIVFSDDLNMGALVNHYTLDEILINAINAGTDVLVIGNNLIYDKDIAQKSINIIKNAVKDNKISIEKINNSYTKIMQYKQKNY